MKFYAMAFAQLTFRESLRDIEACLATQAHRLYHLRFRSPVARNTLANANAVRPWQIYADLAQHLIGIERWHRKTEHGDKWKLCDNNPGLMPEKAG